jgi:hypothetical protein
LRAEGKTVTNGTWKGLDPEYALLGGILKQAIRDSRQSRNPALQIEAFEFLQGFAPKVAERLRNQQATEGNNGSMA